jgi:hypothetical protein
MTIGGVRLSMFGRRGEPATGHGRLLGVRPFAFGLEHRKVRMAKRNVPFDTGLLDRLMKQAGIDLLLTTSKPVVQYLLGGYQFFFYEHADAIGQSRYLPILIYASGEPDRAVFIGHKMEVQQQEVEPLWVSEARNVSAVRPTP